MSLNRAYFFQKRILFCILVNTSFAHFLIIKVCVGSIIYCSFLKLLFRQQSKNIDAISRGPVCTPPIPEITESCSQRGSWRSTSQSTGTGTVTVCPWLVVAMGHFQRCFVGILETSNPTLGFFNFFLKCCIKELSLMGVEYCIGWQ